MTQVSSRVKENKQVCLGPCLGQLFKELCFLQTVAKRLQKKDFCVKKLIAEAPSPCGEDETPKPLLSDPEFLATQDLKGKSHSGEEKATGCIRPSPQNKYYMKKLSLCSRHDCDTKTHCSLSPHYKNKNISPRQYHS